MAQWGAFECIEFVFGSKYKEPIPIAHGYEEVEVETVKQLSATQNKKLQQNLEKMLDKKVVVTYKITPELIGGLRIKFGSEMIDNSLVSKLNRLEIEMKGVQ